MSAPDNTLALVDPVSGVTGTPPSLALPSAFVERMVAPLFREPERARQTVALLGAPLAFACAASLTKPALDLEALRAAAQAEAVAAKSVRSRLLALCAAFAKAGVPLVAFKGLATCLTLYPRPYQRLLPDADLLFHRADLAAVVHLLRAWRFVTREDAVNARRWGALTEASFAPVAPPDGGFLVDVHCQVDDPPACKGLSAELIFERSVTVDTGMGALSVPAPEHGLCILALHAFRDFYEPRGLKSLFDAALLLDRHGATLDWDEMARCARVGRFVGRFAFYRALLAEIGAIAADAPVVGRHPSRLERRLAAGVAANFRHLSRFSMPDIHKLAFEAALFDSPFETVRWNLRRFQGVFAPRSHALPGVPHD
ncbi:MAG: nucleotidyltransferase family protein [Alphaproteobacteria bacterium]